MKRFLLLICSIYLLFLGWDSLSQTRLTPTLRQGSWHEEYQSRRDSLLLGGVRSDGFVFIISPSFSGEIACFCKKSTLVIRAADKNIWYHHRANIKEYRCDVSREVMLHLDRLINAAVLSSSYLAHNLPCLDGTRYEVRTFGDSYRAECDSPGYSNCCELVKILESIWGAVLSNDSLKIERLLPAIDKLTLAFIELLPKDIPPTGFTRLLLDL